MFFLVFLFFKDWQRPAALGSKRSIWARRNAKETGKTGRNKEIGKGFENGRKTRKREKAKAKQMKDNEKEEFILFAPSLFSCWKVLPGLLNKAAATPGVDPWSMKDMVVCHGLPF